MGRYQGMTTLEAGGIKGEYLMLTYANDAKLYVPVSSLHLISRYAGGAEENAPLHKLGGDAWRVHARKRRKKCATWPPSCWIFTLSVRPKRGMRLSMIKSSTSCSATASRLKLRRIRPEAINAVLSDMCQPLAMDRLVCGDVGFGKTEVAMRAAFLGG